MSMPAFARYTAVALLVALSLSCGDGITTLSRPATASHPPPVPLALTVTPSSLVLDQGTSAPIGVELLMSDGTRRPTAAHFSSSNAQVASIRDGEIIGLSPGSATIVASVDSLVADVSVVVLAVPTGSPSDALIVQRFYMIELQYDNRPTLWYYAPQIHVVAAPGRSAYITQISFAVPGLDAGQPHDCYVHVTDATPLDLNADFYGDWSMSIETSHQASGTDATATITVIDETGRSTAMTVTGPIVRGGPPASYPGVLSWGSVGTCIDVNRAELGG
jgi:hypothetical protein